jgi:hypothetical protein
MTEKMKGFLLPTGALRVKSIRVCTALLSFMLLCTAIPEFSFADEIAPVLPRSDISAELTGTIVVISPKSDSKYCLAVKDASRDEGARIAVNKLKKKGGAEQRFEIRDAGEGVYTIRSAHTGRLIADVDGNIVQTGMTKAVDDAQRWAVTKRAGGYIFTNAATANRLSVSNRQIKPVGADAEVTDAQVFKIKKDRIRLDGYYFFLTQNDNVIALNKSSLKNNAGMVLKKNKSSSIGRQFFLISSSSGNHTIKNSISFKALSIKGGSKKNGVRFVQKTYKKDKDQRFKLVPSGDGWYLLKSASGTYVSAASDKPKAKIVTASEKAKALKVRVKKTEYSTGVPKLDKEIKKLHKKIGSRGNTMKKSFNYITSHYRHRNHPNDFSGDWISRYAQYMIDKKHGHCKNFAAIVCVLFRSYGYDAQVVTGYVPSRSRGWAVHGWVEASVDGKTYIFDADLYIQIGGRHGWYKRTYKNAPVRYRVEKRW